MMRLSQPAFSEEDVYLDFLFIKFLHNPVQGDDWIIQLSVNRLSNLVMVNCVLIEEGFQSVFTE